jgi:probable HAF family extracellular repeat protein
MPIKRAAPVSTLFAAASLTLAFSACSSAEAAVTWYTVQSLGTLPGDTTSLATGLNDRGDVVGWSSGPGGYRGFVYTATGGMQPLAGLPDRPRAFPRDINEQGDIVGAADAGGVDLGHAVRWRGGVAQDLGTLPSGPYSGGWGINNLGDVVGESYTQLNGINVRHAFIFTDATGMVDITPTAGSATAHDINDAGQVTGYRAGSTNRAFRWQDGGLQDLGVLPGMAHSFGFAIEPGGAVAGSSKSASGNSEHVARYTDGRGLHDLGGTGEHNQAWGINSSLTVVGQLGQSNARAFVYSDAEGLRNLNELIDKSRGWVLQVAMDINAAGQVVGHGYNNLTQSTHAVLLTPTTRRPPECSINCLRARNVTLRGHMQGEQAQVSAKVVVKDESGTPVADAMVVGGWTWPDGSNANHYAFTNGKGQALFETTGPAGTYRLDVVNIVKSLYTFNPKKSELSGTLRLP